MISVALSLIVKELNTYIHTVDAGGDPDSGLPDVVELGNIAMLENGNSASSDLSKKVLLSLVNIEEEKRLKNVRNYIKNDLETEYKNPPISLNLYLLFSANFDDYFTSLQRLSQVIEFFQGKFVFTLSNSPSEELATPPAEDMLKHWDARDLRIILDIHTLNFEQINDLWGSLGGKQVPFVMYRARMLAMKRDSITSRARVIEEVDGKETIN